MERYHTKLVEGTQTLAEQYLMRGGNYQFCWHRSMELMLVLKGSAEVFADGKQYLLEKDDLLLINSNCGHSTFLHDLDCLLVILEIYPEFFQHYFSKEMSTIYIECASNAVVRHLPLFAQLRFFMARVFQLSFCETEAEKRLAAQYLAVLMSELMLHFPTHITEQKHGREGKEKEALQQAMEYIETNYDKKLTLEQMASYVQYNRTYLSTLFKKSTGILFNDYIMRVRLRRSLEALSNPDKSIVDIALDHGFPDSKSFSASMKKYCGRTPQEYRQALKKNPSLQIREGEERYISRPDAAAEELLQQYITGGLFKQAPHTEEYMQMLHECSDQLTAVVEKMKGFS